MTARSNAATARERSAWYSRAVHRDMDKAAAVFHTHMPFASALTRLEDQHIKPIGKPSSAP